MRALIAILAVTSIACGAVLPEVKSRHGGMIESYGFSCECGGTLFHLISHDPEKWHVRCEDCGRDWFIHKKATP